MKTKLILLLVVILLLIVLFFTNKANIDDKPVLKPQENVKVIIDSKKKKTVVVRRKGKGQEVKEVIGSRKTVVTINKDNSVTVKSPKFGFIFEPGLVIGLIDGNLGIGVDAQVVYYKRLGLNIGLLTDYTHKPKLTLSGSYQIPKFINNTSVFLGVSNLKEVVAGVRVAL